MGEHEGKCAICGGEMSDDTRENEFAEAGEWLAEDVWKDKGSLCIRCLENRGRLAMMYLHEFNR
jgi:hypothetical protein